MIEQVNTSAVEKLPTGITSFDVIAKGGLPRNRTTLLSGTAGSGKTIFAMQFLAAGIRDAEEHGVFVTFEESAADIRTNMRSFGWDLDGWEREGKFAFVDASPDPHVEIVDVLENPQRAEDEKILATPTLIKQLPPPLRRVIGDLSDKAKVMLGLEVRPEASPSPNNRASTG